MNTRLLILFLLPVLPLAVLNAQESQSPSRTSLVQLSESDQLLLLKAPRLFVPPQGYSDELTAAIGNGLIESLAVEEKVVSLTDEESEQLGVNTFPRFVATIRYKPEFQSEKRLFRPAVLCVAEFELSNWAHCQEESWIQFQTAEMGSSIKLNGELEDFEVTQLFNLVDGAALVSPSKEYLIRSDDIVGIAQVPGRVLMYSRNIPNDCVDVIHITMARSSAGQSEFAVNEVRWAE